MVAQRLKGLEYAIRDIAVIANEVKKSGKEVYHLNIGDPVKYDFKTSGRLIRFCLQIRYDVGR